MNAQPLIVALCLCVVFAIALGIVRVILGIVRRVLLVGAFVLAVALLFLWFTPGAAHAQETPPAPAEQQDSAGGAFGPLIDAIHGMARGMGEAVATGGMQAATRYTEETDDGGLGALLLRGLGWSSRNITTLLFGGGAAPQQALSTLSPSLLWENEAVRALWARLSGLTVGIVAAVCALWGMYLISNLGGSAAKEMVGLAAPRLALVLALGAGSFQLTQWAGETANGFSAYVRTGDGSAASLVPSVPQSALAWETPEARRVRLQAETASAPGDIVNAAGAMLLSVSRLFSHAVFGLLLVTSGLAALCWAIPQLNRFWRVWFGLLLSVLVGQGLQAICLELATSQLVRVSDAPDPRSVLNRGLMAGAWCFLASVAPALAGLGGAVAAGGLNRIVRVPGPVGRVASAVHVVTSGAGARSRDATTAATTRA
jgi:hypothetical protein